MMTMDSEKITRLEKWMELLSAVMLSLAALATSWSTYQSTLWSGLQDQQYSQANAFRLESTRASTEAGQLQNLDIGLFTNWINAKFMKDSSLEMIYQKRFRPEFKVAFQTWMEKNPFTDLKAPPSPFTLPEYHLKDRAESQRLAGEAEKAFQRGEDANEKSDQYVLISVILALVLFLGGISGQFRSHVVRFGLNGITLIILVVGLYLMVISPQASDVEDGEKDASLSPEARQGPITDQPSSVAVHFR